MKIKNEYKVLKIGGSVESVYYDLRDNILNLNENIIPLFALLGFKLRDEALIIDTLLSEGLNGAISASFIELMTKKIKAGKIPLEKVLTARTLKEREGETPEAREQRIDREIHRALVYRYKAIYLRFIEEYNPSTPRYSITLLKTLKGSIFLTSEGLSINVEKYIELISSYLEAKGSTTYEEHQNVADTINRFFNGAVEITEEELAKYFILDCGIVRINPTSINRASYLRLGCKGNAKK